MTDDRLLKESWREKVSIGIHNRVSKLNTLFNEMTVRSQRLILLVGGLSIASICALSIKEGFNPTQKGNLIIDSLTHPLMQPIEKKRDSTELIPLGKMKGEIDGQFEAFYVAMDGKGNFYMNRNPSYAKDRWLKSDDWKQLSYQDFMQYEKQLHFLPIEGKSKSLKR